jgi:hypothetical protein
VFCAFFVTLLMVPSLYAIGLDIGEFFTRMKGRIKQKLHRETQAKAERVVN